MTVEFINDDFLLQSDTAKVLYHDYAASMPIFDYHCHIPPAQIAEDVKFENLTQAWLYGDHYKWRAMRANGVDERYITGDASDFEKFQQWAKTVPAALGNPLYHWTHLELKRYFGISDLLDGDSARAIFDKTAEMLNAPELSVRNMMRMMNVKAICTTDDPTDNLEHHKKIADDGFEIKVLPTWRPDAAMAAGDVQAINFWIDTLSELTDIDIAGFDSYIQALDKRHEFFHAAGCRLADHGLEEVVADDYSDGQIRNIFDKIRTGSEMTVSEQRKFASAMIHELCLMNHKRGWAQQFHIGPQRNNSTRMMKMLGPNTGFDSMGDKLIAEPLAKILDRLDMDDRLAKTVLYNINPRDNEMLATMAGNFQAGGVAGKMQYGASWWHLDQKLGIEAQINTLANMGLLSRFVGMLTDSRSFLSYPRHEYFRRILCNMLGEDIEKGLLPNDTKMIGQMIQNICYNNAKDYFGIEL